jgi:hypothetical protein
LRSALRCSRGLPGIIMTLHTFGEYLDFHPHIHALVADGLFLRGPLAPSGPRSPACPTFCPLSEAPLKPLEELFRAKVIHLLVEAELLAPERVQILYSWKHSGFNVHAGEVLPPDAKADLEALAQYILRNPFSVEKMTLESPGDLVIYRSRLNAKINRNFEMFTPTEFLTAITQHIPDKGAQMVRYYGWYSNKMRGVRHRGLAPQLVVRRPAVSPPPPLKLPSRKWRDLILRVWHVDPLRCPVCQNPMRVIAVIDDRRVVEKILRHLGAWHDPPPRPPAQGVPGPYAYEPCDDVDPTPDYENVLTD